MSKLGIRQEIRLALNDCGEVARGLGLVVIPRQMGKPVICPWCREPEALLTMGLELTVSCRGCGKAGDIFDVIAFQIDDESKDLADALRARVTPRAGKYSAANLSLIRADESDLLHVQCPQCQKMDTCTLIQYQEATVHCDHCKLNGDVFTLVAAVRKLDPVKDQVQVQRAAADLGGVRLRHKLELALRQSPEHFEGPHPPAGPSV